MRVRILTTKRINTVWLPDVFLRVRSKRSPEWTQAVILGMAVQVTLDSSA